MKFDNEEFITERQLCDRWGIQNREAFAGWFERFLDENHFPYLYGGKDKHEHIDLMTFAIMGYVNNLSDREYKKQKRVYLLQKLQEHDVRFRIKDIEAFEELYPTLKPDTGCLSEETSNPTRKKDYRTDQWKNAKPIVMNLFQKDPGGLSLPEIKNYPPFKACFRDGVPSDSQCRKKLREWDIKLAPGRRKKKKI